MQSSSKLAWVDKAKGMTFTHTSVARSSNRHLIVGTANIFPNVRTCNLRSSLLSYPTAKSCLSQLQFE